MSGGRSCAPLLDRIAPSPLRSPPSEREGRAPLAPLFCSRRAVTSPDWRSGAIERPATSRRRASSARGRRERRRCGPPCARRRRDGRLRTRGRDASARRASVPTGGRERHGGGDAGGHVGDAGRGAGGEGELGGVAEVEGVRAHDDRAAAGRRLDQVLAAERREAAAEQGDVGERVPGRHLEHRIAEPHVGIGGCGGTLVAGPGAAPRQREAGIGDQLGDGLEALRMARHDDQQRPRRGDAPPCREQHRLLAFARRRGDDDAAAEAGAPGPAAREQLGCRRRCRTSGCRRR